MKSKKLTLDARRNIAKHTLSDEDWREVLKGTHKKETYDKFGIPTQSNQVFKYLVKHPILTSYAPKTHPELLENEVFLINVSDDDDWTTNLPDFLVSVRRGEVAYTTGGKEVVEGMRPLFGLLKNEVIETGAGDYFPRVAQRAVEFCNEYNRFAEFDFNGVKCIVNKNTNIDWLFRDFLNASTMDWKTVGPDCVEYYSDEINAELLERNAIEEEARLAREAVWMSEEQKQRQAFEEKVKGIELELIDKQGYDDWKAKNDDGYGKAIFEYAEDWAKLLQKRFAERNIENPDVTCMIAHAEDCEKELGFLGITGFMYGAAVSILANCWKHGEALRKWHNKEFGQENSEGVVNSAIITCLGKIK